MDEPLALPGSPASASNRKITVLYNNSHFSLSFKGEKQYEFLYQAGTGAVVGCGGDWGVWVGGVRGG
jgi:hypothetical protein